MRTEFDTKIFWALPSNHILGVWSLLLAIDTL